MDKERKKKVELFGKACKEDPNLENVFSTIMNLAPFKSPPFQADKDCQIYMKMSTEERRAYFNGNAKTVSYDAVFETSVFLNKCRKVLKAVLCDPELNGYWNYIISDLDSQGTSARVLGQRAVSAFGKDDIHENQKAIEIPKALEAYAKKRTYTPPLKRILITRNLTFNSHDELPVFSEIPGETVDNLKIPDTLLYDYADINRIYAGREPDLAELLKLANEKGNTIACECCSKEPIVPCYNNPDCACYQVNVELKKMQGNRGSVGNTEFSTFKPILFTKALDSFYENAGFACSELCACNGKCTNNSLLFIEKQLFPMELYRNDEQIGFGIRTLAMIPAGTAVMEFVGELTENLSPEDVDYAYQVSYPKDQLLWKQILSMANWTPEYRKKLEEISQRTYYLNPKKYGNIGRTALHSCTANIEVVRVFQKSLSPAHVRLVMVTLDNVFPGTPLTLDYGPAYVKDNLKNKCRCESFACMNGTHFEKVKTMDFVQIGEIFQKASNDQFHRWHEKIYKPSINNTGKKKAECEVEED